MSLLSMLAPVAEDLTRVDALIRRRLDSDVVLVRQVAERPRLRGHLLVFELAEQLGGAVQLGDQRQPVVLNLREPRGRGPAGFDLAECFSRHPGGCRHVVALRLAAEQLRQG